MEQVRDLMWTAKLTNWGGGGGGGGCTINFTVTYKGPTDSIEKVGNLI